MKVRAMIAILAAVCVCGSFVGCGNSSPKNEQELESMLGNMSEDEIEQRIENAAESIDAAEAQTTTEEETVPEIVYEPSDEILNADFASGLVQIGSDVFRNGGYYTVDQFIAEYSDRYDMSEINPDGLTKKDTYNGAETFSITPFSDPSIKIYVVYDSKHIESDKIRTGDTIVYRIYANVDNKDVCWYPKGVCMNGDGYEYGNIPKFLEDNGYTLTTDVSTIGIGVPKNYGAYWESDSDALGYFRFNDVSTEKNLLDCYPLYKYEFKYRFEDTQAFEFDCNCYPAYVNDLNEYPHI